eukprot:c15164_g1_i2.p1 GENE.c15164_g1_i2~~c15164_g1_i2.p1  ORF type:complete len:500 (-),score=-3.16 c15164_g1_i2:33-1532(-)
MGDDEAPEWQQMIDGEGRQFFYNNITGVSQWELPEGFSLEDDDDAGAGEDEVDVLAIWLDSIGMIQHRDVFGDLADASQLLDWTTDDMIRRGVDQNDAEYLSTEIKILKKQLDGEEDDGLTPLQRQQREKAKDDQIKRGNVSMSKQQSNLLSEMKVMTRIGGLAKPTATQQIQGASSRLKSIKPEEETKPSASFRAGLKPSTVRRASMGGPALAGTAAPPPTDPAPANAFGVSLKQKAAPVPPSSSSTAAVTAAVTSSGPVNPGTSVLKPVVKATTPATTTAATTTATSTTTAVTATNTNNATAATTSAGAAAKPTTTTSTTAAAAAATTTSAAAPANKVIIPPTSIAPNKVLTPTSASSKAQTPSATAATTSAVALPASPKTTVSATAPTTSAAAAGASKVQSQTSATAVVSSSGSSKPTTPTTPTGATVAVSSSSSSSSSSDPLIEFLKKIDCDSAYAKLKAEKIDMSLMKSITDEDLKSIGLVLGERKKILANLPK